MVILCTHVECHGVGRDSLAHGLGKPGRRAGVLGSGSVTDGAELGIEEFQMVYVVREVSICLAFRGIGARQGTLFDLGRQRVEEGGAARLEISYLSDELFENAKGAFILESILMLECQAVVDCTSQDRREHSRCPELHPADGFAHRR